VCGGELYQRDDDTPKTVRARLRSFHEQTRPILAYYDRAGLLTEIEGEGAVADVSARVTETFRSLRR
jgi:adenylate kinase